tara:strand:+ start:275 stop:682 length:408 start_codon:yes stop_codon:yes gene_type:complete
MVSIPTTYRLYYIIHFLWNGIFSVSKRNPYLNLKSFLPVGHQSSGHAIAENPILRRRRENSELDVSKQIFQWKQRGGSQTYRLDYKSHGLSVKYRMRMRHMDCAYCDITNANIFDCLEIHGFTPKACIKNTWGHQ